MSVGDRMARKGGFAAGLLGLAVLGLALPAAGAGAGEPVGIAVFDFVLRDKSAAAGIVAPDAIDLENLRASAEEARKRLADSGRYSLVDTRGAAEEALAAAGGVLHCEGCEAALARELGAAQSLAGIVTRVARTEYTLQIVIRDAASGEILSNDFSGLRLGANYSWPRGVKSLIGKRIAATAAAAADSAEAGGAGHRLVLMPPEIEGDLSLPGGTEAWQRRLDLIEETVGRGLAEEGLYRVLDRAPAADLFAGYRQQAAVHQCLPCVRKVAARLGAERVLTLRVYRMSQLVLNLHAVLRDGDTGEVRYARLLSFRGDNDRAWLRAGKFLMRDLGKIPREKL